jgi:O-acetyl-ADP-ribose deacetylase (regulator of RNase III)
MVLETTLASGQTLQMVQGDITTETTDTIVNSANQHLQHGAGVAGAISRRGGPDIQAESNTWVLIHGPVPHEAPAWTSGGQLPCRYVIHAVGPVWGGSKRTAAGMDEDANLGACVRGSLSVADDLRLQSISFPAISTGIFCFPKERAAGVMIKAINNYFVAKPGSGIQVVRLVLCDAPTMAAFEKSWHDFFDA